MKMFILMSIALVTVAFLTYLFSGRIKGTPVVPASMWLFYLIEKIFDENDSSAEGVKGNGMSQVNPGPYKDR
jgi:hypothetical protein